MAFPRAAPPAGPGAGVLDQESIPSRLFSEMHPSPNEPTWERREIKDTAWPRPGTAAFVKFKEQSSTTACQNAGLSPLRITRTPIDKG
ncbi:hypothetical protein E4U41_002845 [Claviceps citrina]|nr:hypothetical protein E4U41_002845 [Claviceps citrina]